jgi:hypothetical protein
MDNKKEMPQGISFLLAEAISAGIISNTFDSPEQAVPGMQ